jgi:hypothetical protein
MLKPGQTRFGHVDGDVSGTVVMQTALFRE